MCKYRKYWTREKMKMSGGLFGGRSTIKVTSELLKSKNQKLQLQFDLWPLKVKWSGASEGNDQTIKHLFCRSWSQTLQQVTYKWLPLGVADFDRQKVCLITWSFPSGAPDCLIFSGNDLRLAQPSQMRLTDYSMRVSGWAMQNPGVTVPAKCGWVGRSALYYPLPGLYLALLDSTTLYNDSILGSTWL